MDGNLMWQPDGQEIWDEEKWEKELKKKEKLLEKYQEAVEKDINENINNLVELQYESDISDDFEDELFEDEDMELELEFLSRELEEELKNIASYELCKEFASRTKDYIFDKFNIDSGRKTNAENLLNESIKAAANIAGGHGLGYDRNTLCGNIVKCKWALENIENCIKIIDDLIFKEGFDKTILELSCLAQDTGFAIEERIEDLRKQVWWL